MSKIILLPINQLNLEDLRKAFKQAKADARGDKASSTVEGDKANVSTTT